MSRCATMMLALLAVAGLGLGAAKADYEQAFVWQTNYAQGLLSIFDVNDSSVTDLDALSFYQDSRLSTWGEYLFVVERLNADAITVLDPLDPTTVIANYSVGNATNPYDILPTSEDKAYVIRYEVSNVLIVDPMTGDSLGTVELADYADADGIPEMGSAVMVGDQLYVALQLIDRTTWAPSTVGLLLQIDTATDAVVDSTSLTIENPLTMVANEAGTELFIGGGRYLSFSPNVEEDILGAGVDRVDLATMTPERILEGADVNGNIGTVALASEDTLLWALSVEATWPNASVVPVNLNDLSLGTELDGPVAASHMAVNDAGQMVVIDRDMAGAGVFVYDAATGAQLVGKQSMTVTPDMAVFAVTNLAPRFADPRALNATEGTEFSATFSATDEEGDAITLSAVSLPPGADFDPTSGTLTWTPGYFDAGEQEIILRAADQFSHHDQTFTIAVSEGTPADHQESIFVYMTDYVQGSLGSFVVGHSGVTELDIALHGDAALLFRIHTRSG